MKLIGISARFVPGKPGEHGSGSVHRLAVVDRVNQLVSRVGAIPLALPLLSELEGSARSCALDGLVARLDGLLLQGGTDIEPHRFGEPLLSEEWPGDPLRDQLEFDLLERWLHADKPVLGVCRGHQVLNVALGGSLYQDLPTQHASDVAHDAPGYCDAKHAVRLQPGGLLHTWHGVKSALINSAHHQAVKQLAPGALLEATAPDGIIEAFRHPRYRFAFGVQWHPEFHLGAPLLDPSALMQAFASHC